MSVKKTIPFLGYAFNNPRLLISALTHRSVINSMAFDAEDEHDNQRLEFLGDAVLDLFIGEYLFKMRPRLNEGEMTRLRASLVNESRLAEVARKLKLGKYLFVGAGEEQGGGRNKNSLLADAMEALLGAVYLDGGSEVARNLVIRLWSPYLEKPSDWENMMSDFKTRLQELTQKLGLGRPLYEFLDSVGPPHDRTFIMRVSLEGWAGHQASGRSKKEAEQLAAKAFLDELNYYEKNSGE